MVYLLRNSRNATTMEIATVACDGDILDSLHREAVLVHFNPSRERHKEVQTFYLDRCVREVAISPSREPFEIQLISMELLIKGVPSE